MLGQHSSLSHTNHHTHTSCAQQSRKVSARAPGKLFELAAITSSSMASNAFDPPFILSLSLNPPQKGQHNGQSGDYDRGRRHRRQREEGSGPVLSVMQQRGVEGRQLALCGPDGRRRSWPRRRRRRGQDANVGPEVAVSDLRNDDDDDKGRQLGGNNKVRYQATSQLC